MTKAQFGTGRGTGGWKPPLRARWEACRYTVAAGILPASERGFQPRDSSDMMRTIECSLIARSLKNGLGFPARMPLS